MHSYADTFDISLRAFLQIRAYERRPIFWTSFITSFAASSTTSRIAPLFFLHTHFSNTLSLVRCTDTSRRLCACLLCCAVCLISGVIPAICARVVFLSFFFFARFLCGAPTGVTCMTWYRHAGHRVLVLQRQASAWPCIS